MVQMVLVFTAPTVPAAAARVVRFMLLSATLLMDRDPLRQMAARVALVVVLVLRMMPAAARVAG